MSLTIIIVAITVLITIAAFNSYELLNKLILYPRVMNNNPAEYYRFLTSGFIHADWNHLIFNMVTLYSFGNIVESFMGNERLYAMLYLLGIILSSTPGYFKNRNNSGYRALGASGGVSSVLFFSIYYFPWSKLRIMFIPIDIPAILFAALYLAYTIYMSKRGNDNIGHDAHLLGAAFGIAFALVIDPTHGASFIEAISNRY